VATTAGLTTTAALIIYYDDQLTSTTVSVSSLPAISGTVTANIGLNVAQSLTGGISETNPPSAVRIGWSGEENFNGVGVDNGGQPLPIQIYLGGSSDNKVTTANPLPISGTVTIGSALPAGTNRIGVVTIEAGTVTLGASTAQIGSVTASISGTVPISISSVTVGNSVTIGSCVTHGVTISNTVVTFFPAQGTTVTNSNFTSTTASTTLVSAVDGREVLTVFNEGAGNLHISPGATCTTVAYQVRLSAGDYWECPLGQLTLAHTAVFATAGTARVTQVS
jgi:hypothetical protein